MKQGLGFTSSLFCFARNIYKNTSPYQFYPIYYTLPPISDTETPRIHKALLLLSRKETEAAKNCLHKQEEADPQKQSFSSFNYN